MDYPLEEFFAAIAAIHEMLIEDDIMSEAIDKSQFMHLVVDALDMMCECGQCDEEDRDKVSPHPLNWQIAMVSLFGNLEDIDVAISVDGTTNIYEATHKSGMKASVQCPRSEIGDSDDHDTHMIKAMERLHEMLKA